MKNTPKKIERDLYNELRIMGLTSDQCSDILDWTEKLPINILQGIVNTKVSVKQGLIIVEPTPADISYMKWDVRKFTTEEQLMLDVLSKHGYGFNSINKDNEITVRNAHTMQSEPANPPLLKEMFNHYKNK